jgi:hypothetical protein
MHDILFETRRTSLRIFDLPYIGKRMRDLWQLGQWGEALVVLVAVVLRAPMGS